VVAAAACSLVAVVGQGVAGAAPTPKYTVTCTVGDRTIVRWQRASLSQVTFDWSAPAGSGATYQSVAASVSPKPSHGLAIAGTPINPNPATATVTLTPADGGQPDTVTVNCS
jgi:hypothetical protein